MGHNIYHNKTTTAWQKTTWQKLYVANKHSISSYGASKSTEFWAEGFGGKVTGVFKIPTEVNAEIEKKYII